MQKNGAYSKAERTDETKRVGTEERILFMKREQAKAKLIEMGVSEPTDAQIGAFLDTLKDETDSAKNSMKSLKEKADRADELEKQLEEMQNQGLSDVEKAKKDLETANQEIANLKISSYRSEARSILNKANLDDETIEALLDGTIADSLESTQARANALVNSMNKVRESTIKQHKKEQLNNTDNPDGGSGGDEAKSESEKIAETIASSRTSETRSAEIQANYM